MPLTTEDKLEIMELTSRYNFSIDRREPEAWADTFTEDGELWAGGQMRATGRRDLEAYMRAADKQPMKIRHWTSNTIIEGDGNQARLRMYVMAWDITGGGLIPYVMGDYDDTVVKVKGKWKFKRREVTPRAGKLPTRPANLE